jgi:putative phage-type endonuclease
LENKVIKQQSKEWYEARKHRVTGSVAGAILGLNPWMTADDVMRMMVREYHGAEREFTGNIATEWGNNHEPEARLAYDMISMGRIEECGFYTYEHWLGASPDGTLEHGGLIEIKCPFGKRNDFKPEFKSISEQPHYHAQMQIEMLCADRNWCHFFQWTPRGKRLEMVVRDNTWLAVNVPKLRQFYEQYLVERLCGNCEKYLEPLRAYIDDGEAEKMVNKYLWIKKEIKELEDQCKPLLENIVKLAGNKDASIAGHKLTKVERAGSIAYAKAVKDLLPDADLKPYTGRSTEYWRLS